MKAPMGIGFAVKTLSNLIKHCIDKTVSVSDTNGITSMQGWIIGYLYHHSDSQDAFQHDLENKFNIRRSTATGILQRMERDGLIIRKPFEDDARRKKIILTEKAISIHENVMRAIAQVEKKITDGLTKEETETFLMILEKIKKNIE